MYWQIQNYYGNVFMLRLSNHIRHLIRLFGQDVLKPFILVGQ